MFPIWTLVVVTLNGTYSLTGLTIEECDLAATAAYESLALAQAPFEVTCEHAVDSD